MYIRFLQSQPPVTETFKILFNILFLQNVLAMIYSNCSFGRFSHFGIKMWKTIIIAVIIHMMNTKLCRGQTINVFSFSPAPFVSKYDSNDVVTIGFSENNFTAGFTVCLRIAFTTWNISSALQTSDGNLQIVKSFNCFIMFSS